MSEVADFLSGLLEKRSRNLTQENTRVEPVMVHRGANPSTDVVLLSKGDGSKKRKKKTDPKGVTSEPSAKKAKDNKMAMEKVTSPLPDSSTTVRTVEITPLD